jgi:hypothetical protein
MHGSDGANELSDNGLHTRRADDTAAADVGQVLVVRSKLVLISVFDE